MMHKRDNPAAIDGGRPLLPEGPPGWPPPDDAVRQALERALADGSWGRYHGPHLPRLCEALAEFFQLPYVYPCCSGTFAVELALRALRLRPGDEVVLAGYDYPGNFRAIEAIGARPVLVDVDPFNWNLDPACLAAAIGPRVRAVVVSHLHGGLAPMRAVVELAKRHGVAVVEDICQSPGAVVEGQAAGTWGDVAALSFGGSKLLSAGRGGAIMTRLPEVRQRAKVYCEQGNHAYPLSELQAAVLMPQLARLAERNNRRLASVARLLAGLGDVPWLKPLRNRGVDSTPAYYKLGFQYDASLAGCSRADYIAAAQAEGVAIDAGFRGFMLRGEKRCRAAGDLTHCRHAAESALVLHHPVLLESPTTIDRVAQALARAVERGVAPDR